METSSCNVACLQTLDSLSMPVSGKTSISILDSSASTLVPTPGGYHHSSANTDAAQLAELGYKQEFKRQFSLLETAGFAFSMIGLVPSMSSVLIYAIPNGGPVAMVWGWVTASGFIIIVSLALSELGSAAPTSGGAYYWTHRFSSPRTRNLLSWIVGYSTTIGLISVVTSIAWGCALQIMACASIGTGLDFTASNAQTFGVFTVVVLTQALIASFGTRVLARIQNLCTSLNILLVLALVVSITAATPKEFRNSAPYALGNFQNLSPWPNGFAFALSFLAPLWTIGGCSGPLCISEEATNASIAVPFAIMTASTVACVLGFAVNMALVFFMGTNLTAIVENPIGQPMATILFNSLGNKGSVAVFAFIVVVQFLMGTSVVVASSRQIFAFSRDGALPFSLWLYRINKYTLTPVNCVWFSAIIAYLLGILVFARPAAIGAIFSLGVAAQYLANGTAISARFLFENDFKPGPFDLGRFSFPISLTAVLWMLFIIIVFLFPSVPNPTSLSMNYVVVVLFGWILLSLIWYYFPVYGGVHWFKGPISNILASEDTGDTGKTSSLDRDEKIQTILYYNN